jgi:hypothetical protein
MLDSAWEYAEQGSDEEQLAEQPAQRWEGVSEELDALAGNVQRYRGGDAGTFSADAHIYASECKVAAERPFHEQLSTAVQDYKQATPYGRQLLIPFTVMNEAYAGMAAEIVKMAEVSRTGLLFYRQYRTLLAKIAADIGVLFSMFSIFPVPNSLLFWHVLRII